MREDGVSFLKNRSVYAIGERFDIYLRSDVISN